MYCVDEGMAQRDGEHLNIQCLLLDHKESGFVTDNDDKYHYHKYIELIYMLNGTVEACAGSEAYLLNQGDMILIYPGEPHLVRFLTPNRYIVVKFLPEILVTSEQTFNEFEYIFNFNSVNSCRTRVVSGDKNIGRLMNSAYKTFSCNNYCSELFVRADIIRVCGHILDFWHRGGEIVPIRSLPAKENLMAINRIAQYTKSVNGAIRTHEAAGICGLSDGYFSRIFKSLMGMTFTQYVKSVKIAEAERLLKCSDFSVTDIAQRLCYATASHFIEDFKKEKGISPKKYRML